MEAFCIFVSPYPQRQANTNPLKMKTVKVLDKEFGQTRNLGYISPKKKSRLKSKMWPTKSAAIWKA